MKQAEIPAQQHQKESHLVYLERDVDDGFPHPLVPGRVMDEHGLYWEVRLTKLSPTEIQTRGGRDGTDRD